MLLLLLLLLFASMHPHRSRPRVGRQVAHREQAIAESKQISHDKHVNLLWGSQAVSMQDESNWSAVPVEVLRRAFELQRNGLANCGAAAACIAWRDVARGSRVNSLYLHADSDHQELFWRHLLAARSSIDSLKLVRTATWSAHYDWCTLHHSAEIAQATMDSIPTACRSLSLSEFCAHGLARYIKKAPELEQLTIQWNGLPHSGTLKIQTVPDLAALHRLTELTVQMRNDIMAICFQLSSRAAQIPYRA